MQRNNTQDSSAPATVLRRRLGSLFSGGLGITLGFAVTVALMFSSFFMTSFVEPLLRSVGVALLLLAFVGVQRLPETRLPGWLPRRLPHWALTLLAMALAAPAATLLMYLFSVRGDVGAFVGNPARITGLVVIAGTALVLGMLIALSAQLRQREAEAHALQLRVDLERSQLERQALDARLSLRQAQVQPNVLFNTLANVQALVESGSPRAYLELIQMRMPDRLHIASRSTRRCSHVRCRPWPS